MAYLPVLSHYQATQLLHGRQNSCTTVTTSLSLNHSETDVLLTAEGVLLPNRSLLPWSEIEYIQQNENACFQIDNEGHAEKISLFSDELQRAYSLFPTLSAPTMLVSGITMHRIVNCDPHEDTKNKIKAFGVKPTGHVLDTTMGLGYTAIEAARTAAQVTTIELDPTVEEICRANPWSQELFTNPNVTRHLGHCWDVLETVTADSFSFVVHDPPMFNMAGELYSTPFYSELYRVLRHKGRLFHYIGNPNSKSGATHTRGVIRRLKEAGFKRVSARPQAFGVLALKT